ncbi:MAG TPA: helix-turn-helix transcriptional regulator [Gaiellaceae bacterium]
MHLQLIRTSPAITDRQRQIVALIAAGCSNEEVGRHLSISARTAKAHCDTLRQKLGVERRRQIPGAYYRLTGNDPFMRELSDSILLGG